MLLSKKTSIKSAGNMRTSSGICAMQHPSSGMSVITSVSITKKQGWSSILTGTIRKKPIKRICGINSSRPDCPGSLQAAGQGMEVFLCPEKIRGDRDSQTAAV